MININLNKELIVFSTDSAPIFTLFVGYEYIAQTQFKNKIAPTPYDVELAIIAIEDAIMQQSIRLTEKVAYMAKNDYLGKICQYSQDHKIMRDDLERYFNRVADIIAGSPARDNELLDDRYFISYLLILRELMHHLDIEAIIVR